MEDLVRCLDDLSVITADFPNLFLFEAAYNPVDIDSLLIARHGKLVFEEYFHGFDPERTHDMRSASKTFAPVLAGIALDHGSNLHPETPIYPFFEDERPFAQWDARKSHLRLRSLMTMTSGLSCDDNDDASPGNEDNMQRQTAQPNWYKYTLDLPMVAEPAAGGLLFCGSESRWRCRQPGH